MLAAASAFNPTDPFTWIQGGAIGVVAITILVLFIRQWVVPGPSHEQLRKDLETARTGFQTEIDAVRKAYTDQIEDLKALYLRDMAKCREEQNVIRDRLEGDVFKTLTAASVTQASANDLMKETLRKLGPQ